MAPLESCATDYANRLLGHLGAPLLLRPSRPEHPALRWAHCGAMFLTGNPAAPPQMSPVPLAAFADGILTALRSLQPGSALDALDGAALLGERAALSGYRRGGDISAGGGCRLLQAADGYLALSLARPSDRELLPAWLERGELDDWDGVAAVLRSRAVEECVVRGRLLGLAVAPMRPGAGAAPAWCEQSPRAPRAKDSVPAALPRVVDLSSLWAGPLCSHLLQQMGARVVKVESRARPDGMRAGDDGFFDLLNAGKASVALDLANEEGRAQLRRLLLSADIIIEGSRPRALRQLGIHAEQILAENPRATWVSITGYGRAEPAAQWVAFGDDAAVAGGLSQVLWDASGQAMFCADAIADPLTGLHAALVAWWGHRSGGGRLYALSLAGVAAHAIACSALGDTQAVRLRTAQWSSLIGAADIAPPRARPAAARARALGADTAEVLGSLPR
jgi:crotonobetainyl-CoA:carnitine CoA-transferase CaiB-like acyl-CoA transferase